MPTTFRPEELDNLKKALAIAEKDIRYEARVFWIQLVMGLLFAAAAFYALSIAQESRDAFNNAVQESLQDHKVALVVDRILQIKIEFLRSEFSSSSSSLLLAVAAGALIGGAVVRRSRRSQNHAHLLVLRYLLESQTESPNKPLNADAGDAGAG